MKRLYMTILLSLALNQPAAAFDTAPDGTSVPEMDTRCTLSAGAPIIDYGVQSRWQLQDATEQQKLTPGKRTLVVNIVCPYSQTIGLIVRGDKASNGDLRYGDRGHVILNLLDAQLDGQPVQLAKIAPDRGGYAVVATPLLLQPGNNIAPIRNGQRITGKHFSARIELEPVMPETAARVSSHQVSEANLTLELMD
jgi:hypothetical protein